MTKITTSWTSLCSDLPVRFSELKNLVLDRIVLTWHHVPFVPHGEEHNRLMTGKEVRMRTKIMLGLALAALAMVPMTATFAAAEERGDLSQPLDAVCLLEDTSVNLPVPVVSTATVEQNLLNITFSILQMQRVSPEVLLVAQGRFSGSENRMVPFKLSKLQVSSQNPAGGRYASGLERTSRKT